jgi:hypothetical protein
VVAELSVEMHDPGRSDAPPGWADLVDTGGVHGTWSWPVIHAAARHMRGTVVAASISDDGKPVGIATAVLRLSPGRWPHPGIADVKGIGSGCLPGIALAGRLPGPLGPGVHDIGLLDAAVHAFEAALRERFSRRIPVLYRNVYADMLPAVVRGVSVVRAGADVTVLRNTFDTFDAYLKTLRKSRRVDQRRLLRQFDDKPDVSIEFGWQPTETDHPEMIRLAGETARRNQGSLWMRPPRIPPPVLRALIGAPCTWLLRYGDRAGLLGWGVMYDHPLTPMAGTWGSRDPKVERDRSGIWFDQLARTVRRVIETGRGGLIEGKGMAALKVDCGFSAVPQWSVLRGSSRA